MEEFNYIVCPDCQTVNRLPVAKDASKAKCGKCKQVLFDGHPLVLGNDNFDRHVLRDSVPVLIDFWAPWCGPCKMMAPIFEQAAARLEPRVRLGKLDTEEAPAIASRYGIRSIPTLMIFKNGRELARQSGAMDLSSLLRWVESRI